MMTARRYFRRHWADCEPVLELFEALAAAAAEEDAQSGGRRTVFQPHVSAGALQEGLANGSLMRVCLTTIASPPASPQHALIFSHQPPPMPGKRMLTSWTLKLTFHLDQQISYQY